MPVKGMSYYHVNTRSLFSKLRQLEILYPDTDVLCCTETWLDNRFSDVMVGLSGKKIFRCDRKNNVSNYNARPTAGGVCIYINNLYASNTVCIEECTKITQDFEILTLVTTRPDHRFFVTICVYKPPKGKVSACVDFLNLILARRDISRKEVWILGDFNTDLLKRDDVNTVSLQAFAKKNGLCQQINSITRPNVRGGSCIDLIMTNCLYVYKNGISDDMISDHYTVYCIKKKKKENRNIVIETVRDYKNFHKDNFCQLLSDCNWIEFDMEPNPATQWSLLYTNVIEILAIMCPYKTVHTRVPRKKWITPIIYTLIRDRKRMLKCYRSNNDPKLLRELRIIRNNLNAAIDKAKMTYVRDLLRSSRKDPKRFWRNIKSVIDNDCEQNVNICFKDPDTGNFIPDDEACNFVNDVFATISERTCKSDDSLPYVPGDRVGSTFDFLPPERFDIMLLAETIENGSSSGIPGINAMICKLVLLHIPDKMGLIYANSMFSGIFPADWAMSTVKLLPKSGDLSYPGNWRPISTTNIFSKILEKLVHVQVLKYLMYHSLINENQFGFLPGKSTHEAIFRTIQQIYSAINNKKLMGMLLLDMAKAFNCIHHDILFIKMHNTGFSDRVIDWFRSYLNRTQRVRVNNNVSRVVSVKNGIAQGTVLGPILFIFYINDIFECVKNVHMSLFADDCVLYLVGNNWLPVSRKIQTDFDAILEWTYRNNLRLNPNKTKAMIFGPRNKLACIVRPKSFFAGNNEIGFVKQHLFLGIMLDSIMSLTPLTKDIKKRITNKIFNLRKIRKFLTFEAALSVYKQTILPIIDYAGFLLISCKSEDFQKLQNDILRICTVTRLADKVSIRKLHEKCKIISLEQRMRKQLLWLMYILSKDEVFRNVPIRVTRSGDKIVFKVPTKILPMYERSPYYKGTKLWNELTASVQDSPDIFAFKKEIARMNRVYVKL